MTGQLFGQCQQRLTHAEWLKFLRKIERQTPKGKTLHLIADNYATPTHPAVQAGLAEHPRFVMHFTPTSASWLNMVERFFRDITTERLRGGVFTSVPELVTAIDEYIAHHNTNPKPFSWTKTARDIQQKVIRANSRLSSKQNAAGLISTAIGSRLPPPTPPWCSVCPRPSAPEKKDQEVILRLSGMDDGVLVWTLEVGGGP